MAERVDVPGDARPAAGSKRLVEEAEAHGHLVDDGAVVGGGLVAHAPAAVDELQTTWWEAGGRRRRSDGGDCSFTDPFTVEMRGSLTFVNQLLHRLLHVGALLPPPAEEERRLHVDEAAVRVLEQLIHHRVQDVLNPGVLDVVAIYTDTQSCSVTTLKNMQIYLSFNETDAFCGVNRF